MLVYEVFPRSFKDRRALGAFVGLTGTPYNSGSSKTEQRISENGNARVRRMLSQLAWRWLGHQPESALAQWFNAGLGGALPFWSVLFRRCSHRNFGRIGFQIKDVAANTKAKPNQGILKGGHSGHGKQA